MLDSFSYAMNTVFTAKWEVNSYTLTFENGEKYTVNYDQRISDVIPLLPVIEKTGYTFKSWYAEELNYTFDVDDIFRFAEDLYFVARWSPNTYKVYFENGEKYLVEYDQQIGEVICDIPVIERAGYSFVSWYCESEDYILNTEDIFNFTVPLIFKAVWCANEYTISFDDGSEYAIKYDQRISEVITSIPVIEKTGYTFLSWCCESENYTLDTDDIYRFTNDISFKSVWSANSYTVSFENGESYTVSYDQKLSDVIVNIPVTERTGYSFLSWYCEDEDYTLDTEDIYCFANDISFEAVWSANSYTVSFENGESYTVRYDQKLSDVITSIPVTEKVGHTFVSWYCESEDCTLNIDDIYHFANDIDFIAVWRINVYTITFENGAEYYVEYGQRIDEVITDIPVIEKVGHTFEAWYCEDEKYIFEISDIYNFARSINFTAVWTPNTYTVAFENGAVFSVRYGQSFSEVISAVPAIKKTGYTFKSWYCQSNNYTFDLNDTLTCAGDVFFRAVWEINKYTVSFEGGITYTVEYSQRIDEIIAVSPIIKRSGYTFKYWYCDEQDYILDTADLFGFTEDLYFKAIWSANAYTITLDANGGELIGESVYGILYDQNISEVISELPVATNGFYELQYWYCEESDYILDIDKPYSVPDNIILKAVWKDEDPFGTAEEMVREYRENMLELYDREKRSEEIVDIILFAGQSNSCGRATADEISDNEDFMTVDESKAFTFYNNKFTTPQKIEEPITGNGTDSKYYGYIPTFLNTYYDNTGRRVCACFKSVGGMMMNNFLPYTVDENGNEINSPAKYYKEMVEYINHAKLNLEANGYTVGNILMVWCQGEADAAYYGYENNYANVIEEGITEYGDKVDYYKRTFTRMFESLQADAGLEKAFIVRIGHSNRSEECLRNQPIIDAHTQLCSENEDLIMVSTLFAGAKTFRMPDGTEVNLMRDASHYLLEGYLMAGKEAGLNAAIYVNSEFNEKPMLLEYHRRYLESQGLFDTNEYEHEYLRYIFDPDRINT